MEGLKKSHIRDGAAVVQYLVWLDKQVLDFVLRFYFSKKSKKVFKVLSLTGMLL